MTPRLDRRVAREAMNRLMSQQGSRCAICGCLLCQSMARVDHDHVTGHIRGVLCDLCNRGVGCFRDSVERLRMAAEYLNSARARSRAGEGKD